jgi:hypothetical protein
MCGRIDLQEETMKQRRSWQAILLFILTVVCGCGGGSGSSRTGGSSNSGTQGNSGNGAGNTSQVIVRVSPGQVTMGVGETQTFTAAVTGSANTAVDWQVKEGSAGGTITPQGYYQAPFTPGTYHVVAISQSGSNSSVSVPVTVIAGGGVVTVQ